MREPHVPRGQSGRIDVTLGFWIIKILATTLGETGGDTVTMTMDLGMRTRTTKADRKIAVPARFAYLMAVLGLWYWSLGSISVETVNTPKVEAFYWTAITFSQTYKGAERKGGLNEGGRSAAINSSCLLKADFRHDPVLK